MWRETPGKSRKFTTGVLLNKDLRVNDLDGSSAGPELLKCVFLGQSAPVELESSPLTR
jgi:hypothetical protein